MSFSRLVRLIGPAPSELPRTELLKKLSLERDRVRSTLDWFRSHKWQPKPAKPPASERKTGGKPAAKATTIMKKKGVTLTQLKLALMQLQEEKKS